MDDIFDFENNMDNNNNDSDVEIKHDLSGTNIKKDFLMESNNSDVEENEYALLSFDSPKENSESTEVKAVADSNSAFQDKEMSPIYYNDDLINVNHDYSESEVPKTEMNITNKMTDNENVNKTNKHVDHEVDKNEEGNPSNIRQSSFEKKTSDQKNTCDVCLKTVYPMEKTSLDSKVYHKNCFRCCVCQKSLTPTVVTKSKNNLFCKPHYIEKFRMRGKYDDIDINNPSPDTTTYNQNYTPINQSTNYQYLDTNKKSDENKEKFVKTKDLASRFEDSTEETSPRKEPVYTGTQRRVSDAAKAWTENPGEFNVRRNSNNNNMNDSEINQVSKVSVKNLKTLFESKN